MVVPIQVITIAQAKKNPEPKIEEPMPDLVKKRKHKSWRDRKAHLVAKKLKEEEVKCQENDGEAKATTSTNNSKHEGGLVLTNKIFEPLDTLLMAYKSRLKSKDTLKVQWKKYPDLKLKKGQFAICKCLIKVTQKLVEQKQEETNNEMKLQIEPQQPMT